MTKNLSLAPAARHDAETDFLDVLGPSWSAMTPDQRFRYAYSKYLTEAQLDELARAEVDRADHRGVRNAMRELLDVALQFPQAMAQEGPAVIARRWGASDNAVELAELLERAEPQPSDPGIEGDDCRIIECAPRARALRLER